MTTSPSPSPFLRESYKSLLDRALSEPLGLVIEGEGSINSFEVQLSRIKELYPQYASIMVCVPSIPDTLYLVKKSVELVA